MVFVDVLPVVEVATLAEAWQHLQFGEKVAEHVCSAVRGLADGFNLLGRLEDGARLTVIEIGDEQRERAALIGVRTVEIQMLLCRPLEAVGQCRMHILDSAARKRVSGSEQCQCRNGVSAGAGDKPLHRGYKRDAQHRTARGDVAWLLPCGEKQGGCKPTCDDGEILPSRVA